MAENLQNGPQISSGESGGEGGRGEGGASERGRERQAEPATYRDVSAARGPGLIGTPGGKISASTAARGPTHAYTSLAQAARAIELLMRG